MVAKKGDILNPKGNASNGARNHKLLKERLLRLVPEAEKMIEEALKRGISNPLGTADGLRAATQVFDRVYGKPVESIELSGKDGTPLIAVIKDA